MDTDEDHVWITISYNVSLLEAAALEQLFSNQIEIERGENRITASIKYHDDSFEKIKDWQASFTKRMQMIKEATDASWKLIKEADARFREEEELAHAAET